MDKEITKEMKEMKTYLMAITQLLKETLIEIKNLNLKVGEIL